MALELRFHEDDWARIMEDYAAWWAHELDRPLVQITGVQPDPNEDYPPVPAFWTNFGSEVTPDELAERVWRQMTARRFYGDAFPHVFVNYGPGIAAAFMGARLNSVDETVWFEPAQEIPIDQLALHYDPDNAWWQRIQDVSRALVERMGSQVQISHSDIGGNLDILASFRTTQQLLLDLYDAPDEVERLVNEITEAWIRYYDVLDGIIRPGCPGTAPWAPIWADGTTYMLQCDFSYMISPRMFERFVLPDLEACCEHLSHGFYHLDGPGEIPHVDLLLGIDRLRGIQWVPGDGNPPHHEWLDLLGRIIEGGKLCQIYVAAESALEIVRHLGGKGFMFTIMDSMSADEAESYLATLAREDVCRN
ncbi:MAG: hypothetical protein J7M15_06335 [Anaerolineae bacterium]|nr:hypothetical protein [Anaerolineae bacterium]